MMNSPFLATALVLAALLASPIHAQEQAAPPTAATETSAAPAPAAAPEPAGQANSAEQPAPVASSSFSKAVTDAIGTPKPGKALVVFFRPSKFMGGGVGFKVRENEVELGKLRNANYFVIEVDPGQHTFVVHSEAKDVTNIEVEEGDTFFLSAMMTMGVIAYHPNLSPSNVAAFEAVLPKLKKSKPLN